MGSNKGQLPTERKRYRGRFVWKNLLAISINGAIF